MPNALTPSKEIIQLREKVSQQEYQIKSLLEYINSLKHKQFGSSSEKCDDQIALFNEAEQYADDLAASENTKSPKDDVSSRKQKKRVSIPAHYPLQDIVYDLNDSDKVMDLH